MAIAFNPSFPALSRSHRAARIGSLVLAVSFGWGCKQYPKTTRREIRLHQQAQPVSPTQPRVLPPPTLQPAVAVAPLSPKDHERKAREHLAANQYGLATHHAQQLAHVPGYQFTSHYLLGRINSRQGNWKEAKRHYEISLSHNPDSLWANNNLGYVALELGLFTIATQALEQATLHPNAKGFMFSSLGIAYFQIGKKERALAAFTEAIRREPSNKLANQHRATLQAELYALTPPPTILPPGPEGYSRSSVNTIHFADSVQKTVVVGRQYELPP